MRPAADETMTAPASPGAGERLAGVWEVTARIAADQPWPAFEVRHSTGDGRALAFLLPDEAFEPSLDLRLAEIFGTTRRVLRDERYGRIVVDEVPDGAFLDSRLSSGATIPLGLRNEIQRRVRESHHAGAAHGALSPQWIVLGSGELALPGWGLDQHDLSQARARDAAALAALAGAAPAATHETPAGPSHGPTVAAAEPRGAIGAERSVSSAELSSLAASLRAAIVSDHLPTLRRAYESWVAAVVDPEDGDGVRARDALARLEGKVDGLLQEARRLLERHDLLGATALCREAIRLGAEEEAEPLLRQARRQAKSMLQPGRYARLRWPLAAVVVLLVVICGWWLGRARGESVAVIALRQEVATLASQSGARAAVQALFAARGRSELDDVRGALLVAQMKHSAQEERQALLALRESVVQQGGRPAEADTLAERTLAELDVLASGDLDQPGVEAQYQRIVMNLDRAVSLYQVSTEISAAQAARAVDLLLAQDPIFRVEAINR